MANDTLRGISRFGRYGAIWSISGNASAKGHICSAPGIYHHSNRMRSFTIVLRAAAATAAFCLFHSAVASRTAKQRARALLGPRHYRGLYRPFYTVQSAVTVAILLLYFRRLPTRTLYLVPQPWAALLRGLQGTGILYALWSIRHIGIGPQTGLTNLAAWLRRDTVIPAPIEAQGPAPDPMTGQLHTGGPFQWSRHPLNFAFVFVFWFNPRMTAVLLGFSVPAILYFTAGSRLEEVRLRRAYGIDYERYQSSGIPFYLPHRPARLP